VTTTSVVTLELSLEEFAILAVLQHKHLDGISLARSSFEDGIRKVFGQLGETDAAKVRDAMRQRGHSLVAERVREALA
jgi:hypothetical protein